MAHTPPGTGVSSSIFNKQNLKIGPKIERMGANNFVAKGSKLTKLFHLTCCKAGIRIWVQLFGGLHP